MSSRNERIDQLVAYARKVMNENGTFSSYAIMEKCDSFMIQTWGLSETTRRDYQKAIETFMKNELDARNARVMEEERNQNQAFFSREKTFLEVFRALMGDGYDVEEKALIDELVKTGKFTVAETKKYIQKMNREGMIFERKPGFWAKA